MNHQTEESTSEQATRTGGSFKWIKKAALGVTALAIGFAAYQLAEPDYISASAKDAIPTVELGAFPIIKPTMRWGFAIDTFSVAEYKISGGQSLSDMLMARQLSQDAVQAIVKNTEGVFDFRSLQAGKSYNILTHGPSGELMYMVYEPSVFEYVLFSLGGDYKVERIEREVDTKVETGRFVVESTLWEAMVGQGHSYELADRLEDALKWSIDFHRIQENDEFKVVFENKYVEGKSVGAGKVEGAYHKRSDKEVYAVYYENGEHKGYYDLEGRPLKTAFLKAPLRFSRISSRYNLNRFHPVLKRRRAHLGTDYAAPHGTEILAVGDGVISQAHYSGGNGNFVRIKHDKVYETQYLHMSRFAKGIRPGTRVSQGQVIGYVGSTGLATGPHVCFRFWKNGKQVDHLRLDLPQAKPLPESEMPLFKPVKDAFLEKLKAEKPVEAVKKANP
ncbi:MAG: peptidoglycan DD-metalloendopeptidase family protein [Saprospiraceae bacterium]|nr:peptidoglycan DD-metalloendopeptidase family protein [Saprospiraceae bacterium]